ncbi:MAG: exodeoxyribonuclease VII large subunit [Acholeplasmatales bacterium]|nr:exodeoxyribonuclease VII large subunit [Acholeplasmatales bacterium]
MEEKYLTVTALTKYIKYKFDHDTHLEDVLLEGEISNFKHNSRGHFYFTLKDDNAQISATMFSTYASKVKFEPEDGMKVFVRGNVSVYEPSGTYQINVKEIKSDGLGDLYIAYEKLKKELEALGLFDEEHKKPIPRFPKTIGVITSPTGAAIRDIINTISRRYPLAKLILYPAIVQGDDSKDDIVRQIKKANADNLVDVLIVGRGGGSIEDLWAFNERVVAYAIYDSNIPIISAVGHEVDFTIADFVADKRAATPTAAAELATPNIEVLKETIASMVDTLNKKMNYKFNEYKMKLTNIDKIIDSKNPINVLEHKKEILASYNEKLNLLIKKVLDNKKNEYVLKNHTLELLNPLSIMNRGYSIAKVKGKVITKAEEAKVGDELEIDLQDGKIKTEIKEVISNGR